MTESELTRAVRSGEVIRARQGVYALADVQAVIVHAASHGGTVGCCAAGLLHGLWILEAPPECHVWMGTAGTPRSSCEDCHIHWDEGKVAVGAPPPVRNVLLQISRCATEDTFFAALESALRQSLLRARDLTWLVVHLPIAMRWLVAFARADADSGLESLLRLRLYRLGIEARPQVWIAGGGEVDFVVGARLIIEADGRANHDGGGLRAKDLQRDAAAAALGYQTLRFTYAMIVHDWRAVVDAIDGALLRDGHR
ncbi:DUF559 domain-containing protein [Microbacterium sp. Leaf159]|uniref:DUF559 domain-containing protein n=1 Tax=Microbacterium sp. Leaf159 TaxID=1736279 RepID=UPI0009EC5C5F|nr:DUF559 domain-containing protein [Microbacterium sp. Leaf159]